MDQGRRTIIKGYEFAFDTATPFEELLAQIDLHALEASAEVRRLMAMPMPAVVDTSFLFTGFQSQLRNGGVPPMSLQAARQGAITLLMAEETVGQVFEKLDEFASSLGTTSRGNLARLFADAWAPWIRTVDLDCVEVDGRAQVVVDRDPTDRPVATLASLLSPCLLLTTDKDFESLVPIEAGRPGQLGSSVVAVSATLVVGSTTTQVRAMFMVPTLPVAGVVGSVQWLGQRTGVSPWIIGLLLVGGGILLYRQMSPQRRAATRRVLGEFGTIYVQDMVKAQAEHENCGSSA